MAKAATEEAVVKVRRKRGSPDENGLYPANVKLSERSNQMLNTAGVVLHNGNKSDCVEAALDAYFQFDDKLLPFSGAYFDE